MIRVQTVCFCDKSSLECTWKYAADVISRQQFHGRIRVKYSINTRIYLYACWEIYFSCSFVVCWSFFKINFFKKFFQEYHLIVKQLGLYQAGQNVRPDLDPNCLQKLSAEDTRLDYTASTSCSLTYGDYRASYWRKFWYRNFNDVVMPALELTSSGHLFRQKKPFA